MTYNIFLEIVIGLTHLQASISLWFIFILYHTHARCWRIDISL